jgi:hypothetical protein
LLPSAIHIEERDKEAEPNELDNILKRKFLDIIETLDNEINQDNSTYRTNNRALIPITLQLSSSNDFNNLED